ncbi:hypothetical protein SAY87_020972 [Trapa incisa]|uniref:Glycosyltransferase n=1 Tax=Trapa incisa TaxID=236973 RepID=A0AAN7JQP0_9MYRT|nr:hypothetical protein SAY87_020972 [Trapa incisa]
MAGPITGGREASKPHAVCFPFPAQGHINPMLTVAKLLHHRGFHITFVHTEFNYRRLLAQPASPSSLQDLPAGFRVETISDGLPLSALRSSPRDLIALGDSIDRNCPSAFRALLSRLSDDSDSDVPAVSCIVSDSTISFTVYAAEELGVPGVLLWTSSASSLLGCLQFPRLIQEGFIPLKDETCLTNGYLDTVVDWIPGMKSIRLRDLPTFIRTTQKDDVLLAFSLRQTGRACKASAVIFNTFEPLDRDVLEALSTVLPRIYPVGPLNLLLSQEQLPASSRVSKTATVGGGGASFWEEDRECLEWLESRKPKSVIYVNFGSIAVATAQQLVEFAWGIANSGQNFLWVIRPDLMARGKPLPTEFTDVTRGRGLVTSWVPQEEVLGHPSIGGFLTHCGWNSILESISNGVPMLCWPFGADQPTNCRYCCTEWGIGMEIVGEVKRDEVEMMVRDLMVGVGGGESRGYGSGPAMRERAAEWKRLALEATRPNGSSRMNFDRMVREVLLSPEKWKMTGSDQQDSA